MLAALPRPGQAWGRRGKGGTGLLGIPGELGPSPVALLLSGPQGQQVPSLWVDRCQAHGACLSGGGGNGERTAGSPWGLGAGRRAGRGPLLTPGSELPSPGSESCTDGGPGPSMLLSPRRWAMGSRPLRAPACRMGGVLSLGTQGGGWGAALGSPQPGTACPRLQPSLHALSSLPSPKPRTVASFTGRISAAAPRGDSPRLGRPSPRSSGPLLERLRPEHSVSWPA